MNDTLSGKRAYITGGASGLGAACASLFAESGARVVISGLASSVDKGTEIVDDITANGGDALFVPCDVTDVDACGAATDKAIEFLGGIDVLVTSAGIATHPQFPLDTPLVETTPEHWAMVLDVNLTGTFYSVQHVARRMIAQQTGGSIITIASAAAKRPSKGPYSVSKAGVWMLTRALAVELGTYGIRVNSIAPGVIETPMLDAVAPEQYEAWKSKQEASLPLARLGQPLEVAQTARFLASQDSGYMTGSLLQPDGGLITSRAGG